MYVLIMYVCMYVCNVCMYVCMYVCMHACMHACMYVHISTYVLKGKLTSPFGLSLLNIIICDVVLSPRGTGVSSDTRDAYSNWTLKNSGTSS